MAAGDIVGEIGNKLAERIFSSIIWIGIGILILGAVGGTMWYFFVYKRKFNITVKVNSERANDQESIIFDYAAILIDRKTKSKYFKLWKLGTELPVPPFNILQKTDKGDYLELRRTAEDRWYFLTPPKIDKKYIVKVDGKVYPMSEQNTRIIDQDMEFWRVKRKGQNAGMFDPEKLWMKLLPYIPHILAGGITIFVLYILMSYLPAILSELRTLSESLNSQNVADVTTGLMLSLI